MKVSVALAGPNSVVSVVCPASACSWAGKGIAAGDSTLWTSDGQNGGNGPVTVSFDHAQAGVGAFIQADAPGPFVAQIQVFDSTGKSLGTFTETGDAGTAVYIGVLSTSANIASATFSLSQAATQPTDFVLDTLYLTNKEPQ